MASWSKAGNEHELSEVTTSAIRMMDEDSQKGLLFAAIRACELNAIRNVLQVNRNLVHAKMYGYEGSDVFEIIKNSKTKRCYFYTGVEKDGFFYPLHVATEAGHKNLTILLVRAGADVTAQDYRGMIAEEKCTGIAVHAFYELQGLKYEATERYVGKTDRAGQRHNQGVLYFKPEGYEMVEKQLFRGSFKNDRYHGHGTLYWPGQDNIQYIGRFKAGLKHGRGIEFDENGRKIYQGMFRDDKREGRGDEFMDDIRIYKGEFSENLRHGFGVAYFDEGARYYGRYEGGLMCGVGIYCHPNGDRFEGMFFSNKPDGPGSFYERDVYTGNFTGSHALWQAGRKVKDTNFPFVPTQADLPDHDGKEIFSEIMNYAGMSEDITAQEPAAQALGTVANGGSRKYGGLLSASQSLSDLQEIDESEENEEDNDSQRANSPPPPPPPSTVAVTPLPTAAPAPATSLTQITSQAQLSKSASAIKASLLDTGEGQVKPQKRNFTYFDGEGCMSTVSKGDVWKVQLGKYLKLPLKEATTLGLRLPPDLLHQLNKVSGDGLAAGEGEEAGGADDDDSDVEVEEVSGYHFMDCMPLFVSYVYVTSASKVFEDRLVNRGLQAEFPDFEAVYHQVIDAVDTYNESWERSFKDQELLKIEQAAGIVPAPGKDSVEAKRKVFMTEKEKKEQLILKQRAELALKKGTAELPPEIERRIELDVLKMLESELSKLLGEHEDGPSTGTGKKEKLARSHAGAVVSKSHSPGKQGVGGGGVDSNGSSNAPKRRMSHTRYEKDGRTYDTAKMNIEDLFDVFMDSDHQAMAQFSDDGMDDADQGDEQQTNEFADELLYIMRTAMSLS